MMVSPCRSDDVTIQPGAPGTRLYTTAAAAARCPCVGGERLFRSTSRAVVGPRMCATAPSLGRLTAGSVTAAPERLSPRAGAAGCVGQRWTPPPPTAHSRPPPLP